MPPLAEDRCAHTALRTTSSPVAKEVGYQPRSLQQLFTASTGSRKRVETCVTEYLDMYPAPLVLPEDELVHDPEYPPQGFVAWKNEKERNVVTTKRAVVYVAEYPTSRDPTMGKTIRGWSLPTLPMDTPKSESPAIEDVLVYLQAFFHGMPVKKLDDTLAYTPWTDRAAKSQKPATGNASTSRTKGVTPSVGPRYFGLTSSVSKLTTRVRVRFRESEPYHSQLNLDDLLDQAMCILPSDAYALLLLVDHDLYEDEDDDFCVGRAYGASRIAVVSGARYRPELDGEAGIDRTGGHWWPASHCEEFVQRMCGDESKQVQKGKKRKVGVPTKDNSHVHAGSPLQHATTAHDTAFQDYMKRSKYPYSTDLYTRRVCLTASHELLHCFGLDHCVYFACAMQGASCLAEDSRQPPYLCPVCENKLAAAIALKVTRDEKMEDRWWDGTEVMKWRKERRERLIEFCKSKEKGAVAYAGLSAWYRRVIELEGSREAATST